jgi:hypothetical protein
MNEFYEYLMLEMASDINGEWQESSQRAHELCFLLSLDESPIPEVFLRFYASKVDANEELVMNAVAFFSGMGLLDIHCDCAAEWKNSCDIFNVAESDFYEAGISCKTNEENLWNELTSRLCSVREEFGVGEPI